MPLRSIAYLDASGHLALTWDPAIPESVERARAEFQALRDAGYTFFRVVAHQPQDSFEAEVGALQVERITPDQAEPRVKLVAPVEHTQQEDASRRRRGRPPRAAPTPEPEERVVAARPMRGG